MLVESMYKHYIEGTIKSPTDIEDVRLDFKPVVIKDSSTSYLSSFIRKIFQWRQKQKDSIKSPFFYFQQHKDIELKIFIIILLTRQFDLI